MKKIVILLTITCIAFIVNGQTIVNPSNTPGYDAQKLSSIYSAGDPGASLTADSTDYHPGSTVTFTGGGFLPGETVSMNVEHSMPPTVGPTHQPWTVTAD